MQLGGAGLSRYLAERDVRVVEVNRPNRQNRRRRGKDDAVDAEAAARAVMSGEATAIPKAGNGPVEALRQLRVARNGAIKARTAAANQLHSLCDTAPDGIRSQLRGLSLRKKVAVAERWRPGTSLTVDAASKRALTTVARRWRALDAEVRQLDAHIKAVLDAVAAPLLSVYGVGYETAGQLLVTAGDKPQRLGRERSFAALCGATPVKASSGKTSGTASTAAAIATRTRRWGRSCSLEWPATNRPRTTWLDAPPKGSPPSRSCDASSATSPASSIR